MRDRPTPSAGTRNPLAKVLGHRHEGTVTEVGTVTPSLRRIRIVVDEPFGQPFTPGQHVRIEIRDPLSLYGLLHPVQTRRAYSIWEYSAERRCLELRIHLYGGDGIGLSWAQDAQVGDRVAFWGPEGNLAVRPAPYHLFVGEETATVAFGPMIAALAPTERVYAVLESDTAADEPPLPGPDPIHRLVRRVHRAGGPAASSPTLLAAVAALDLPDGPGVAYVAGEARTGQQIRNHLLRERGWPRSAITVKAFWTPGRRGLHH